MSFEVATLIARLEADIRGFDSDLRKAERKLDDLDGTSRRAAGGLDLSWKSAKNLAIAAGVGFGMDTAIRFMGDAIGAASDLNESTNAVKVVFGEASDEVIQFAADTSDSVFIAQSEFQTLASQMGQILQGFDLPVQESADLTLELGQRAADMASVMNTTVPDAVGAIGSALRGETEPIRRYIGSFSIQEVQDFAAATMGVTGALTPQERALATVNLILEKTAKFQGDAANTADEFANKQRALNEKFENAKAALGDDLLPLMVDLIEVGENLIPVFEFVVKGLSGVVETAGPLIDVLKFVTGGLDDMNAEAANTPGFMDDVKRGAITAGKGVFDFAKDSDRLALALGTFGLSEVARGIWGLVNPTEEATRAFEEWYPEIIAGRDAVLVTGDQVETTLGQGGDVEAALGFSADAFAAHAAFVKRDWKEKVARETEEAAEAFREWEAEVAEASAEAERELRDSMGSIVDIFGDGVDEIEISVEEMVANITEQRAAAERFETVMRLFTDLGLTAVVDEFEKKGPAAVVAAEELAGDIDSAFAIEMDLRAILGDEVAGMVAESQVLKDRLEALGLDLFGALAAGFSLGALAISAPVGGIGPGETVIIKGDVIGLQHGGVVPGPIGAPVPILAHGGEIVTNPHRADALQPGDLGGGGTTTVVQLVVNDRVAQEIVVQGTRSANRRNRSIA